MIEDILTFWFADPKRAWKKDPAFDQQIRDLFDAVYEAALRGEHEDWRATPRGSLAYVIALDQFPRNMFRKTARMYEGDAKSLAAAKHAVAVGQDIALAVVERGFLYMPFMHSESLEDQRESIRLYTERCPDDLKFARQHFDIVERFGRFPHRNQLLGRDSTTAESEFLASGGPTFGV